MDSVFILAVFFFFALAQHVTVSDKLFFPSTFFTQFSYVQLTIDDKKTYLSQLQSL